MLTNLVSSKGKAIDVRLMSPYFAKRFLKENRKMH
jgi:hypothetical protein